MKRISKSYLFQNGMIATVDEQGAQIPILQGEYSVEKHLAVSLLADNNTEFKGWSKLDTTFIKTIPPVIKTSFVG